LSPELFVSTMIRVVRSLDRTWSIVGGCAWHSTKRSTSCLARMPLWGRCYARRQFKKPNFAF